MRLLAFILLLGSFASAADLIPTYRMVRWDLNTFTGIEGDIPTGQTMYKNAVTEGADNTGVSDCKALVQTLFNACPSNQYVYFPAGVYRFASAVTPNGSLKGASLRGAGKDVTWFNTEVGLIAADNFGLSAQTRLHASLVKGDTNVVTTIDYSSYVGRRVYISRSQMATHSPDLRVISINGNDYILGQTVEIVSVTDNTNLVVWPPLAWNFSTNDLSMIQLQAGESTMLGFQDFTITNGTSSHFVSYGNSRWYISGVKARLGAQYFVNGLHNFRWQVRGCDIYSTNSGSGSAVILESGGTGCVYENNYSRGGSPMFEINGTAVYNVFGYNYATNSISDDFFVGNPYDHHSPHPMFNLWEGNKGSMLQFDQYFGSQSHDTVYRNLFDTVDPDRDGLPRAIDMGRWATSNNIVGNILGSSTRSGWYYIRTNNSYSISGSPTTYRFGYPHPGNAFYKSTQRTPETDWRWPGEQNRVGLITNTATLPTNRIAGTFTNITAGDLILIQSAADTNWYYPLVTNGVYTYISDVQPAYIEYTSRQAVSTNNDIVWKIGDGSYYEFLDYAAIETHLLHGNYDYTNNAIVWDRSGTVSESNLVASLYLPGAPTWFTNKTYLTNITYPPVIVTNGDRSDWSARSFAEDADPPSTPVVPGKGKRTGLRGPQRR